MKLLNKPILETRTYHVNFKTKQVTSIEITDWVNYLKFDEDLNHIDRVNYILQDRYNLPTNKVIRIGGVDQK